MSLSPPSSSTIGAIQDIEPPKKALKPYRQLIEKHGNTPNIRAQCVKNLSELTPTAIEARLRLIVSQQAEMEKEG